MFLDRIRRLADRPYPGRIELAALAVLYGGVRDRARVRHRELGGRSRAHRRHRRARAAASTSSSSSTSRTSPPRCPAVPALLGFLYVALHFAGTAAALTWVHRRHPHAFPFLRTTLIVSTALALVGYVLYPAAPPRLADLGFADTVTTHTGLNLSSDLLGSLYNPIAAVPSLHFGYSLIVGVAIAQLAPRRSLRLAGAAYPALMLARDRRHRQPLPLRRLRRRGSSSPPAGSSPAGSRRRPEPAPAAGSLVTPSSTWTPQATTHARAA